MNANNSTIEALEAVAAISDVKLPKVLSDRLTGVVTADARRKEADDILSQAVTAIDFAERDRVAADSKAVAGKAITLDVIGPDLLAEAVETVTRAERLKVAVFTETEIDKRTLSNEIKRSGEAYLAKVWAKIHAPYSGDSISAMHAQDAARHQIRGHMAKLYPTIYGGTKEWNNKATKKETLRRLYDTSYLEMPTPSGVWADLVEAQKSGAVWGGKFKAEADVIAAARAS